MGIKEETTLKLRAILDDSIWRKRNRQTTATTNQPNLEKTIKNTSLSGGVSPPPLSGDND